MVRVLHNYVSHFLWEVRNNKNVRNSHYYLSFAAPGLYLKNADSGKHIIPSIISNLELTRLVVEQLAQSGFHSFLPLATA